MKLKKMFLVALVTVGLVAFLGASAGAALQWNMNCEIVAIGAFSNDDYGQYWVALTNLDNPGSYTGIWFQLHPDYAKQMLATGLTALASGKIVWAYVDFDAPASFVYGLMTAK